MAAGLVSEINEEFLVCQICYNDFDRPKILPCLHTFCQACLEKLVGAQADRKLSCPTCRQDLYLSVRGVQGLKDNFLVSKLRDVVTKPGRPPTNAHDLTICRVCSAGSGARFHCVDCHEYLCQVCTDAHRRLKLTRAHKIVSTDDLSPGSAMADPGSRDNDNSTSMCPRHGEINKFHCDTCHLVICLHCVVTAHKEHRYVEIAEVAEREKKNVRRLLPVARGIVFLQQAKLNEMHSLKQKWDARVEQTVNTVEARAALMIEAIQELKRAKISHIQALYAASKKELDSAVQAAEGNLSSAKSFIHFAENIDGNDAPVDVLAQARDLTGRLQQYIDDNSKGKVDFSTSLMDMQFHSTVTDGAEELDRLFGSLSIRTPGTDPWPSVTTVAPSPTPQAIVKPSRTLNPTGTARLSTALGKRGSGDGEFDWAASVFVNTEGFILASDVRNKRLQVMDEENLYGTINLGFEPWDVACKDNGDLLVTGDGHSIHVLDSQGKEKDTINVMGFREKDKPSRGIAVDRLGRIIVTIGWQVFVLLPDGTPVHTLSSSTHHFGNQLRVTTNRESQVIVSDWRNDIIKVFGADGQFVCEFGLYGSGDGYFDYPTSVHTDDHNNIIVADSKNHRVSQFSKDGTFVRHLLTRDNGLWHPQGVAITPDGKLVVSDRSENSCVKIYTFD